MQETLLIAHAVVGGLFIVTVLVQDKGVGFGGAIGGTGGGTGFYATQRGAAKVIHYLSLILCTLFFLTALAYVLVPNGNTTTTAPPTTAPNAGMVETAPSVETDAPVDIEPVPVPSE